MFNIAIVGCGRIAVQHAEILGEGRVAGTRLAAVCDIVKERADTYAARYHVPAFYTLEDMLQAPGIDAVAVLTPSGLHPAHTVACARAGKHVICEKPMALRLCDADRMIEECDKNGVRLFVIKQNRFNLPVVKLREMLEKGRFGKLTMGTVRLRWMREQSYYDADAWRGTWKYDGGALTNQAIHHIDLLRWMLGDVESVKAYATTSLAKIEAEDTAVAILRFKNGALGAIEATSAARPDDFEASISVLGEKGTVVIAGTSVNKIETWRFQDTLPEDATVAADTFMTPPNVYGFGHLYYYEHMIDCLTHNRPALVDGREARRTVELLCAIYEAITTGKEVTLPLTSHTSRLGEGLPEV